MLNQLENNTSTTTTNTVANSPIPSVKKPTPAKSNKLAMILGVALFFLVATAGVAVSLKQFFVRESVAPTAPTQSKANVEKVQDCSLSFNVAEPAVGASCVKNSYRDELSNTAGDYELNSQKTQFEPGETVVYSFEVKNTGDLTATIVATDKLSVTSGNSNDFSYQFLDSNCGTNAYNSTTKTLTCTAKDLGPGQSEVFNFRIKLANTIGSEIKVQNLVTLSIEEAEMSGCGVKITVKPEQLAQCNEGCSVTNDCAEDNHICVEGKCRLKTNINSTTCQEPSPTPTPSASPKAECNEACSKNSDCAEANHVCSTTTNTCRLATNPGDANCRAASPTPTPITSTKAMCGEYCSKNSDCAQSDHICYFNQCRLATYPDRTNCTAPQQTTTVVPPAEIAAGCNENCRANSDCSNSSHICFEGKCRLESYPNSSSCTIPSSPDQPKMPAELPKSGSDDLMNWIKAGIGILGAGALLLLL